jgi:hypothetical protein
VVDGGMVMEQERFDGIVRLFGRATTRRAGIGTLAALAAAALGRSVEQADAKPGKAGPCGNGSQKANQCKKDSDCCTGYCKQGVCRGVPLGGKCSATRKCRGKAVCVNGKCARSAPVCDATTCPQGCCNGTTCVPYANQDAGTCGTGGAACLPCLQGDSCLDGVCAASCIAEGAVCTAGVDTCCAPVTGCAGVCGSAVGGACTIDAGCIQPQTGGSAICQGNTCCNTSTTFCLQPSDCCSGSCTSFKCDL